MHLLFRVDGTAVLPNTQLARRPSTPQEFRDHQTREMAGAKQQYADDPDKLEQRLQMILAPSPEKAPQVLIETRGEGGFVVAAPSGGPVHPNGRPWVLERGGPDTIPTITAQEYRALHDLARALDVMPQPEPSAPGPVLVRPAGSADRPGDRFNRHAMWRDILEPHGWAAVHEHDGTIYWRRPGKTTGVSATTGRNEHDRLYVFSTSTEFDAHRPYDKLGALALLEHGGTSVPRHGLSPPTAGTARRRRLDRDWPRRTSSPRTRRPTSLPSPSGSTCSRTSGPAQASRTSGRGRRRAGPAHGRCWA